MSERKKKLQPDQRAGVSLRRLVLFCIPALFLSVLTTRDPASPCGGANGTLQNCASVFRPREQTNAPGSVCCCQGGHSLIFNLLKLSMGRDLWVKAHSCMPLHNATLLAQRVLCDIQTGNRSEGDLVAARLNVVFALLLAAVARPWSNVFVCTQSLSCRRGKPGDNFTDSSKWGRD